MMSILQSGHPILVNFYTIQLINAIVDSSAGLTIPHDEQDSGH
jgi:hypothetical protein